MKECKLTITMTPPSDNGLGHEDVVAGKLHGHVRSKRGGAGFEIAKVTIKGRKGRACADDPEVNRNAAGLAEKILRGIHEFAAKAGYLPRGIHTEHAPVAPGDAKFDGDDYIMGRR